MRSLGESNLGLMLVCLALGFAGRQWMTIPSLPPAPAHSLAAPALPAAGDGHAPSSLPEPSAANAHPGAGAADPSFAINPAFTGDWKADGLCGPDVVTPSLIRMVFDPQVLGSAAAGASPMAAGDDSDGVTLGPYRVGLDFAARAVTVTGPEGADVLRRDIERCIGPIEHGKGFPSSGMWRWSDTAQGWRYVDVPFDAVPTS